MEAQEVFAGVLASLHEAALDDSLWPRASALIDDACGTTGHGLTVSEGFGQDAKILFTRFYSRGQRLEDLEREYFDVYHPQDERIPRLRALPDGSLFHVPSLYTDAELRTSFAYNEGLRRTGMQNGLNVRLDGPDGTRIIWAIANHVGSGGWSSDRIETIERLVPHIRQFVRFRQALAGVKALGASFGDLLDNARIGVIHLDRGGRIVEANETALDILRRDMGLSDHKGFLGAWLPADNVRLQRLLARGLPPHGGQGEAAAGSVTIRHSADLPKLALHISPVHARVLDFGIPPVAALVLVVDPARRPRPDAGLVADVLCLSAAESQVAVMLAEGRTIRDIARATDRQVSTVKVLLRRAYRKLGISRQTDLVRLVLSLPDVSPQG